MAKAKAAPQKEEGEKILPLPEALVRHHGEILFRSMRQWLEQKNVPPVLLLTGPSGVGKREMGYFLSQWLLCERSGFRAQPAEDQGMSLFGDAPAPVEAAAIPDEPRPCGECVACQKALSGNWVDFTEISADAEDGETGTLKIDQFRKLKDTMGFGAYDGAYRITLIRDADRMTVQAANSLLKLLEEPPPSWVLLLTASDAALLLPTLVSRCQKLRLRPLPESTLVEVLEQSTDLPADRRVTCAKLSQGSWRKAVALADPEAWERRDAVLRFLDHPAQELNALVDWSAAEPANFQVLLDQLEQALATRIRERPTPELLSRAERVFRARQESLAPLNRKLLAQDVLMPFLSHGDGSR